MGRRIEQQPDRPVANEVIADEKNPCWVERQRLRRIYQGLVTYHFTRSEFLLDWARDELMHIVRDA
jgi:hypothetical protein